MSVLIVKNVCYNLPSIYHVSHVTQSLAPGDCAAKVSDTLPGKFHWTFVLGLGDSSIASIRERRTEANRSWAKTQTHVLLIPKP